MTRAVSVLSHRAIISLSAQVVRLTSDPFVSFVYDMDDSRPLVDDMPLHT